MTFHSEHGQDRWLAEGVFADKRNGVFVEIGALDGLFHSNSLFFEQERGWTGLLVEPNPDLTVALRRNRPNASIDTIAVYYRAGIVRFELVRTNLMGWSGIVAEFEPQHGARMDKSVSPALRDTIQVPCAPLAAVLRAHQLRAIDYLSIDIEGAEAVALKPFPFADFAIDVISVENNFGRPEIDPIMGRAGYAKIGRVGNDDFYRRP